VIQGLGVAGPRIVALAVVRDLYQGRQMASIMSYAMMVFTLVPAIAPALGAQIMIYFGWRAIFLSFIIFAVLVIGWMMIRQPETLPTERRVPFRFQPLLAATKECFSHRVFTLSMLAQILSFAMLFGMLSSTQQIFTETYEKFESFPLWFAVIALLAGSASIVNARLVERLGMRYMAGIGYGLAHILSIVMLIWFFFELPPFVMFLIWGTSIFFMAGLVIGNLNALAMEPVGHIAGLGASIMGAIATVVGVVIAAPVGLAFDGTPMPLAIATCILSGLGLMILRFGLRDLT